MKKSIIALLLAALLLAALPASAAVYCHSADSASDAPAGIYVAGNDDFPPFERYNSESGRYEGMAPRVLEWISERTGIDFVYIRSSGADQQELAENLQVEMVSAYRCGEDDYAGEELPLLCYADGEERIEIGLAFTAIADEADISAIRAAAGELSAEQISGFLVASSTASAGLHPMLIAAAGLLFALLALIIVQDTVKLRRARRQSRISEMTDVETGIGNLAYFRHHFENSISDHARSLYYAAYIMIDSEYLQTYHRQSAFSDVVKYTAGVLASFTRHNEISARITENGFAFAFQAVNREDAARELEEIISKLNRYVGGDDKRGKPVFHAAAYNLCTADRSSELILLSLRRNCILLSGSEKQIAFCDFGSMHAVQEEKATIESINQGFEKDEFKLYLQFVVDNKSREIVSAEALSRWESRENGLLTPDKYIETMEATALISRLDFHMFEMVCRQLEKWRFTPFERISISCNFTRITISEQGFTERIRAISDRYAFDRSKLMIEITEDAMEKNRERAMRNMQECKRMGFEIALDDLGSGYTSLANLCDYPIDVVKIDRDILHKAGAPSGQKLFAGIVALAHSLHLKVVCEGVETQSQRDFVAGTQCDYAQGWYYSRVFPAEECEGFIRQYSENIFV